MIPNGAPYLTVSHSSSGLLLYAATVDLLAEDFLSEEAQHTLTKKDKISAFCFVLLGGMYFSAATYSKTQASNMCFSCWHVHRWCFCLNTHPASVESSEVIRSPSNPKIEEPASLQASSPDIRQTEIHRLISLGASYHDHEKLGGAPPNGTMADPAGNKLVPRFSPESVRAHHTALAFPLLFQAVRRNDGLTSLSVSRSEQRVGAGADRNTDKENPTHSFTNLIADPASTRRLRRCMVRVISLVKTGRGAITVSLGQIGRGAHLGTGMRRRPIYFPFFF